MAGKDGGGLYSVLGVDSDADAEAITDAYRDRVKETHPDVSDAPEDTARERFRAVNRAYEVLSDPTERRRYDRLGHEAYLSRGQPTQPTSDPTDATGQRREPKGRGGRSHPADDHAQARTTPDGGHPTETDDSPRASVGSITWGAARWLRFAAALLGAWQGRLTPAGAAISMAVFVVYPVFLVSTVTPWFPLAVNLTVGACTFLLLGYLVTRPEVGIPVFGGWTLLLPVALTVADIGVVSLTGVLALSLTVVPLVVTVATLSASR